MKVSQLRISVYFIIFLGITQLTKASKASEVIEENKEIVFLPLEFKAQERGGICTGASMLNILEFLGIDFRLTQSEFFALFDSGRSGASPEDTELGAASVGYSIENIYHKVLDKRNPIAKSLDECIEEIKNYLSNGIALSASKRGHALTLVGYNLEKGIFYAWDQKDETIANFDPTKDKSQLTGLYEVEMGKIWSKFYRVDVLKKDSFPMTQSELEKLEILNPELNSFSKHRIAIRRGSSELETKRFIKKIAPILINGLIANNRKVVIFKNQELIVIDSLNNNKTMVSAVKIPSNEKISLEITEVAELILDNSNVYFSYL